MREATAEVFVGLPGQETAGLPPSPPALAPSELGKADNESHLDPLLWGKVTEVGRKRMLRGAHSIHDGRSTSVKGNRRKEE